MGDGKKRVEQGLAPRILRGTAESWIVSLSDLVLGDRLTAVSAVRGQ